jgi:hypothetical protein
MSSDNKCDINPGIDYELDMASKEVVLTKFEVISQLISSVTEK